MPRQEYKIGEAEKKNTPQRGFGPGGPGGGLGGGEKAENFGRAIGKLIRYGNQHIPAVCAAVLLAGAGAILNIIGPGKLADITDLITQGLAVGIDIGAVTEIAVFLAVLYGIGFLCSVIQGIVMATVTQRISQSLRSEISMKINRLPLRYFDGTSTGNVLSRMTNDVDTIGQTLNQSLGTLVSNIAMFFGSLIMMFYTNWIMALSAVIASISGFALMLVIISRSQKYFAAQQNELGILNGHIEESYAGHRVIKAYNGETAAKRDFESMNQKLYGCAWKSQFMSGLMQPLMMFVGNFGYVVVCIVGAVLAIQGKIPFSVIVAFMMYIRLFTQPLSQLAQAFSNLQSAAAASERVFEFLAEEEQEDESKKTRTIEKTAGRVEFEHVRFGYQKDKTIIHDFMLNVKSGQKVAIVGPTGAGKTTIINLLMRFYEIDSGTIKIDGIPIQELKRENVHEQFCMVLQDTWLFEGTMKENIIYAKEGVSDSEVISVSKAVGLHHFIKTLPKGYDTVLDDKASLSAGQRQLVTIARAMIANAPMLILDEATSSVDTRTETLIQNAMDKLMAGRTSFVIAHRLSTIRNADIILVMKEGDIIEKGTHEELMRQNGFYAELYNSQFEQAV